MRLKQFITMGIALIILGISVFVVVNHDSKNGKPTDNEAPVATLYIPSSALEQAKLDHSLVVSVQASDNKMIERVEYLLDGKVVARSIEPPFKVTINIAGLSRGKHTLQALAYDFAGNVGKSKVFSFTIEADEVVVPADETSEEIVSQSNSTRPPRATSVSRSFTVASTGAGNSSGSSGSSDADSSDPLADPPRTTGGWYAAPPAQVCGSNAWKLGPASSPAGAVVVPAGDNTGFNFGQSNKTYWFAPGEHTLGSGQFSKVVPGSGSTYIGAPGAILD
ncbi:MAG TPA: Ig-like domain-containing protein, partial [Candidatus Saccharimonadales bacterium]|nr:Ig-like domain-containing protein [Candidatus Saccharimonadales bacterium]